MKTTSMQTMQTPQKQNHHNGGEAVDQSQLIQQRAYEKFLKRGKVPGYELQDWLEAEREVSSKQSNRQTA